MAPKITFFVTFLCFGVARLTLTIDMVLKLDKSGNEWVSMQAKYLQYLNMAEEFEEPGKVRRAIKLTV